MGLSYIKGIGVTQDYKKVIYWCIQKQLNKVPLWRRIDNDGVVCMSDNIGTLSISQTLFSDK
ncbi:MAG: hypothetical protein FWD47_13100 [Treponema sp.]|nr:hypothetical protein [Treponema sp.]